MEIREERVGKAIGLKKVTSKRNATLLYGKRVRGAIKGGKRNWVKDGTRGKGHGACYYGEELKHGGGGHYHIVMDWSKIEDKARWPSKEKQKTNKQVSVYHGEKETAMLLDPKEKYGGGYSAIKEEQAGHPSVKRKKRKPTLRRRKWREARETISSLTTRREEFPFRKTK